MVTSNTHQIDNVKIPRLQLINLKRSNKKAGGVAVCVHDNIEIKPRDDLSDLGSGVENLWFEIKGNNRNSNILIGVFHQPNFESS